MTKNRRITIGKRGTPNVPQLMLLIIEALKSKGGSASIKELEDHIIDTTGLTEEELSFKMPNGRSPRFNYFLGWARTYLKKGNAIENSARGVWSITEIGKKINSIEDTTRIRDQAAIDIRKQAGQKKLSKPATASTFQNDIDTGADEISKWKDELLSELFSMDPSAFERLTQRLLREAGFTKVEVLGCSNDGGIDGVGILQINLVSFQVFFQCKRWRNSVGSKEIRDFRGALQGRADKGLFITTSTFTKSASEEAIRAGTTIIDLIDGDLLCDLLKNYKLGVETVEQINIDSKWLSEI